MDDHYDWYLGWSWLAWNSCWMLAVPSTCAGTLGIITVFCTDKIDRIDRQDRYV